MINYITQFEPLNKDTPYYKDTLNSLKHIHIREVVHCMVYDEYYNSTSKLNIRTLLQSYTQLMKNVIQKFNF
jgi:hypothetical protein